MSKTHKRALFKRGRPINNRRTINKRRRKSIRKYKNKKMVGGAVGECPVCYENKPLLKMEHSLDSENTLEKETRITHEMCRDCFMKLNPKNCPLCRRPVERLINMDDNHVAWPVPPVPLSALTIPELMTAQFDEIPVAPRPPWTIYTWAKYIKENENPFIHLFYERLSELPDEQIINYYKSCFSYSPHIIFKDLVDRFVDYSKSRGKNIVPKIFKKTLNNIDIIKAFLAYILVVEVVMGDYFNRIQELFGW